MRKEQYKYTTPGNFRINSRASRRSNLSNKKTELRYAGEYRERNKFERRKQTYQDNERSRQGHQLSEVTSPRHISGNRETFKSEPRGVLGAAGRN